MGKGVSRPLALRTHPSWREKHEECGNIISDVRAEVREVRKVPGRQTFMHAFIYSFDACYDRPSDVCNAEVYRYLADMFSE